MLDAALKFTAAKPIPEATDHFQHGQAVVYPGHGIGRITAIRTEQIAGHQLNVILIEFDANQMTLRVPVAQAKAVGLRSLSSKKQLLEAVAILSGHPRPIRGPFIAKSKLYVEMVNSGDLNQLAQVVRDLQPGKGKSTGGGYSRRNLFELALERFTEEFAAVNQVTTVAASEHINQMINKAQLEHREEPAIA
jgi:CarD family transcriptional regulator